MVQSHFNMWIDWVMPAIRPRARMLATFINPCVRLGIHYDHNPVMDAVIRLESLVRGTSVAERVVGCGFECSE